MNLANILHETVRRQPKHLAVVGPREADSLTYAQLWEEIETLTVRLIAFGIGPKDTVALHYPSGRDYILLTYAIWRCGACVVPIAVELAPQEKRDLYREIGASFVISRIKDSTFLENTKATLSKVLAHNTVVCSVPRLREHPQGFLDLNPAFLRFSSGTTGASKGVVLSHETVYDRIYVANKALKLGPEDRVMWLLSMSYHFTVSIVSYLTFGATIVLCRDHFARTIIDTVNRHGCTFMYGSPVHYDLMANDVGNDGMPTLRRAISTASYLRSDVAQDFGERFGIPVSEAYGIIEVGLPCINVNQPEEKRGSVGRILDYFEVRLQKTTLGSQYRSIGVRGPGMLDAYYSPWRTRDQICSDGWFSTGDLGYVDSDGYLFITGRSKEVIITGGMKFFPLEIESILESHPEVQEAWVYAVPDDRMGELPNCQVVLKHENVSGADLRKFCWGKVAAFKIPREFRFVDELQRTASGKLVRQRLATTESGVSL
jgi:long-chain acyl-CoA synthetase